MTVTGTEYHSLKQVKRQSANKVVTKHKRTNALEESDPLFRCNPLYKFYNILMVLPIFRREKRRSRDRRVPRKHLNA
jgi:hypothetical protein